MRTKTSLTFNESVDLIVLNEDFNDLKKNFQKVLNKLEKTQNKSENIKQLEEALNDLINFDLIDFIHNAQ